jgi:hypothetical protein
MSTESRNFVYGLPKAGIIANERLVKHLAEYGYDSTKHTKHTLGLFNHATRSITFSSVISGFGVKYVGNSQHFVQTLKSLYNSTTEWEGELYYGLSLAWDYATRSIILLQRCFDLMPSVTTLTFRSTQN